MKVLFACFIYYVVAYHKCTHICAPGPTWERLWALATAVARGLWVWHGGHATLAVACGESGLPGPPPRVVCVGLL